eukprot:scaffold196_cov371-Prasinococcus_capsulatus_cf.AAC.12
MVHDVRKARLRLRGPPVHPSMSRLMRLALLELACLATAKSLGHGYHPSPSCTGPRTMVTEDGSAVFIDAWHMPVIHAPQGAPKERMVRPLPLLMINRYHSP